MTRNINQGVIKNKSMSKTYKIYKLKNCSVKATNFEKKATKKISS